MSINLKEILLNILEDMPIKVTELPVTCFPEDVTLVCLYELEDEGKIESYMEEVGFGGLNYIRVFTKNRVKTNG